jgi:uncharacterized membrane protein YphA (DoxX/SURF4 family)
MKSYFLNTVKILFIVLFIYAGLSKLLTVGVFTQQLYQSPVIPKPVIPILAYLLPCFEIMLAASFLIDKFIRVSLFIAFVLMLFFSLYLIGLNIFFTKVPCACGGILGNMGYPAHIVFNIVFTFLSGYAYLKVINEHSTIVAK